MDHELGVYFFCFITIIIQRQMDGWCQIANANKKNNRCFTKNDFQISRDSFSENKSLSSHLNSLNRVLFLFALNRNNDDENKCAHVKPDQSIFGSRIFFRPHIRHSSLTVFVICDIGVNRGISLLYGKNPKILLLIRSERD